MRNNIMLIMLWPSFQVDLEVLELPFCQVFRSFRWDLEDPSLPKRAVANPHNVAIV